MLNLTKHKEFVKFDKKIVESAVTITAEIFINYDDVVFRNPQIALQLLFEGCVSKLTITMASKLIAKPGIISYKKSFKNLN